MDNESRKRTVNLDKEGINLLLKYDREMILYYLEIKLGYCLPDDMKQAIIDCPKPMLPMTEGVSTSLNAPQLSDN